MSIITFARKSAADNTDVSGNEITAGDPWLLELDAPSSTVTAYNEVESGGSSFNFPVRGAGHPDLDSLKMVDYSISHYEDQQTQFIVTVNYSNDRSERDTNTSTNPLDAPISYSYDQIDLSTPVTVDQESGDLIINYAGKPPSSPFIENEPLTRITITKNERRYDNEKAEDIRNTVNKQSQRINGKVYTAGTLKLERFTGSNQFDQDDREYYIVTYQVLVNKNGFAREWLQVSGVNKFGNPPPKLADIGNGTGMLDEDGTYRPVDSDPVGLFKTVNTLKSKQWSLTL